MLGNYEFYYLAGLLKKLFDLDLNQDMKPAELCEKIQKKLSACQPQNEKEAYLIQLVKVFKPLEEYDEQMKELFQWGATEERLWQM